MAGKTSKDDVRQAFAERFRQALAEMGYSANEQKLIGKLFEVSGQAARKWAEGQAMPTPSRIPQVAQRLGVRRAWLQDGEGPMRPTLGAAEEGARYRVGKRQETALTTEEARLLGLFRRLTSAQRTALKVVIATMAKSA